MIESGRHCQILEARKATRRIQVGGLAIGGSAPVAVQSMTKVPATRTEAALAQIRSAAEAGAQLMRVAVPDEPSVAGFERLVLDSPVPIIADVHFSVDLALACVKAGAACVRISPLTLGSVAALDRIGRAAAEASVAVRVGVNGARLDPGDRGSPEKMVEVAMDAVRRLERCGVEDLKVSIKASDVAGTVAANRILASRCEYPVHLGLTEAGPVPGGLVKSSAVLALLLCEGIGDTIRVSLTDDPVAEVRAGRTLLRCLGLLKEGVDLVACPGCGRARQDVARAAREVQDAVEGIAGFLTVAVMGCEVNGPGEARAADLGVAGTKAGWVFFRKGEVSEETGADEGPGRLIEEIRRLSSKEDG